MTFPCFRDLYIELKRNFNKDDDVDASAVRPKLLLHTDGLLNPTVYFSRCMSFSEKSEKIKMTHEMSEFIDFASKELDMNRDSCSDLFCSYLYYESLMGRKKIKDMVMEERGKLYLFEQLEKFFFEENLCILRCITVILKHIRSSEHALTDYIEKTLIDSLSSMSSILNMIIPFKRILVDNKWRINEEKNQRFRNYAILLKEELLKLIVWSLHLLDVSADQLCDLIGLIPALCSSVGLGEPSNLSNLLAVIYLKIFNIDVGFTEYVANENEGNRDGKWLWTSATVEQKVNNALDQTKPGNLPFYGFFCLLRCLVKELCAAQENKDSANESITLGLTAKRHTALSQCLAVIQSDIIRKDESMFNMTALCLQSVLDAFITLYDVKLCGEKKTFDELACYLLKSHYVSEQFWLLQSSLAQDSPLLTYLKENKLFKFPFDLVESLSMATNICKSSAENSQKFVAYLQNTTFFCERLMSSSADAFLEVINDSTVRLLVEITFKQYGGLVLPAGSIGQVVEADREYITINWRVSLNGWQLILSKLQSACGVVEMVHVFDLISAILKPGNPKNTRLFSHFLHEAVMTLKNAHLEETESTCQLAVSCLRCLSYSSDEFAYELFEELKSSLFAVCCTNRNFEDNGLYKRIFDSHERVIGKYDFTLSLLRLLEKCIPKALTIDDIGFCSVLSFIMDSIFVNYLQWFYSDIWYKNKIGMISLKIVHKCTAVLAVDDYTGQKIPLATTTCCRSLLYGEARHQLLNIIVDFARRYNDIGDLSIAVELSCQVSLAVSIMTHLLGISLVDMSIDAGLENSLKLPPLLSDIYSKESQANDLFFTSLGSLFNVRFSDQLPILSLICLQKFAEVFPSSLLYGFGSYVDDFCDVFLKRLQSPLEKTNLRVFCIDFLTNCLQYQVGFLEKLQDKTNEASVFNVVNIVANLIKCEKDTQPTLLLASVRFVSRLWKSDYKSWMKDLLSDADFWPAIMAPLTCGESNCFLAICKEIFDILTYELHKMSRGESECDENFFDIVSENWKNCDRLRLFFKKFQDLFQSTLDTEEKYHNLETWTNFLAVALSYDSKTKRESFDECCSFTILELAIAAQTHLVRAMIDMSPHNDYLKLGHAFNETILKFTFHCHKEFEQSKFWPKIFQSHADFVALLTDIDNPSDENTPFRLPLSAMLIMLSSGDRKLNSDIVRSLLESVAKISRKIFKSDRITGDRKITETDEVNDQEMIGVVMDVISSCLKQALFNAWHSILRRHNVLLNAVEFLKHCCFTGRIYPNAVMSICNLFCCAVSSSDDFDFVKSSNFCEFVYSRLPSYTFDKLEDHRRRIIFNSLLDFHSTLADKDVKFCENAITFLRSWEEYFAKIAVQSLQTITVGNLESLRHICDFFYCLAKSNACCLKRRPEIVDLIRDYSSILISRIINFIASPVTSNENVVPLMFVSDTEKEKSSIRTAVAQNPPVNAVITQDSLDYEAFKGVCQPCFSTNITFSADERLTFGHLLMDLRFSSPSVGRSCAINPLSFIQSDRCLTFALLESAVYFYLVEGFITVNKLDSASADLLKRELSSELVLLLSKCCRSTSPSIRAKSPGSGGVGSHSPAVMAAFHGFDMEFLFNARDLADSMSRSYS